MEFKLGQTAQDVITGFKGIITGYATYITGCDQYCLQPKTAKGKDSELPKAHWVDDITLKIVSQTIIKLPSSKKAKTPPGGPRSNTPPTR